MKQKPKPQV